jgi:hypothetical protein
MSFCNRLLCRRPRIRGPLALGPAVWFEVKFLDLWLNVGMPCLGFMYSYIQPQSINLKSNHWSRYGSRHQIICCCCFVYQNVALLVLFVIIVRTMKRLLWCLCNNPVLPYWCFCRLDEFWSAVLKWWTSATFPWHCDVHFFGHDRQKGHYTRHPPQNYAPRKGNFFFSGKYMFAEAHIRYRPEGITRLVLMILKLLDE